MLGAQVVADLVCRDQILSGCPADIAAHAIGVLRRIANCADKRDAGGKDVRFARKQVCRVARIGGAGKMSVPVVEKVHEHIT